MRFFFSPQTRRMKKSSKLHIELMLEDLICLRVIYFLFEIPDRSGITSKWNFIVHHYLYPRLLPINSTAITTPKKGRTSEPGLCVAVLITE